MAKAKTMYVCQNCGQSFPGWSGKCASCGEWNTLVEEVVMPQTGAGVKTSASVSSLELEQTLVSFSQIRHNVSDENRVSTGISELDRVLGGAEGMQGMVPGAVLLIGGEPGIGKSTLLTQMAVKLMDQSDQTNPILYVCGEESPSQIALRVARLRSQTDLINKPKKKAASQDELLQFITSTDVDTIVSHIHARRPSVVIIDSIQTLTTTDLSGVAGSVGQVREAADRLRIVAKSLSIPMFLVGHVTKEGQISGPKILEHIVDAVLELTGERTGDLRLLRTVKNRFGATDEVGVFRVTSYGYESVQNPTELFLEHTSAPVAGSATVCVVEGTRPLLLEVQALVVDSQLAMPRRVGRGIELSRIQVLSAVLQKHCGLPLGSHDIFVSAAGGFSIKEPAVDLGVALAIASSLKNKPLPKGLVSIGELGLLGEIRGVNLIERRVKEAKRLGFEHIVYRKTHGSVRDVLKQYGLLT